jgi:hemoglobin
VREPIALQEGEMTKETNSATDVMSESPATSRRDLLAQAAAILSVGAAAGTFAIDPAFAAAPPDTKRGSLYERLGGVFAIAAVVNYFSDEVIKDPIAGARSPNPRLRQWSTQQVGARLPGLKFMRTLWVATASGGPFNFTPTRPGSTPLGLESAHRALRIAPREFDAVAAVLSRSLDHFHVPRTEKAEVLAAFSAHKNEVTQGYRDAPAKRR